VLSLIIALIFCSITLIIVFAFLRRFLRKYRFARLDRIRGQVNPGVSALVQYPGEVSVERLLSRPGSLDWIAVEEALIGHIEGVDARDYQRVYGFLEELGYVDYYLKSLNSSRMWQRARAAERLGIIRCGRSVDDLIKAAGDKARDVSNMAVFSLGRIGDERGLPAIMESLRLGIDSLEDVSLRIVKSALLSFGRSAVKVLRRALKDRDWRVRAVVVDILGDLDGPSVVEDLSLALFDIEPDVRAKAAKGLGKKRASSAVKHLMILTEDPVWVVRLHSTRALGLIGARVAIERIKLRLFDGNWQVRRVAAKAMGLMKEEAMEPLRDILLQNKDAYAREMVVEEIQRTGLVWSFVDGLEDDSEEVRKKSAETLYAMGLNGALSPLISALEKGSPEIRRVIVGILGRFKAERAQAAVKATADKDVDFDVRKAARAILGYP